MVKKIVFFLFCPAVAEFLLCSNGFSFPVFAFHGAVEGIVADSFGNPLVGVSVWLEGHKIGDATDSTGWYSIEVPEHGKYSVIYEYIGFRREKVEVEIPCGSRVRKDVILKESAIQFKATEVIGRREAIYKSKTPEPTTIIPSEAAVRTGASNIGEALELESGIKLQTRCEMCGSSEVSIQGLPGRFSLILLDGMPLFSGLASKYILDMFPVEFMDKIEVLKGASGAIWGSDAIAGAVNIILPQPAKQLLAKGTYTYRSYGNDVSGVFSNWLNSLGLTAMAARNNSYSVDLNNDSISENTPYSRNICLISMNVVPAQQWNINIGSSYADEIRKGGPIVPESEYGTNPDAEKISTRRWDIWEQSSFGSTSKLLKHKLALSYHNEDGVVEMRNYSAEQKSLYNEISGKLESFVFGTSFLYRSLSDTRLFDSYTENDYGIWILEERQLLGATLLSTTRVDLNSNYGTIFSPYCAIKIKDFNFAIGTGFRTPSIIFESMESIPIGYRYAIRRDKNLTKETSTSIECGFGKKMMFKNFISDIRLNLFAHRVRNFINARFEGLDSTRAMFYYYNLDEIATSTGTELSVAFSLPANINITLGGFALLPKMDNGEMLPFINRCGLNYSTTYKNERLKFELNTTGELNGPMAVQTVYEDSSTHTSDSPVYIILNFRGTRELGFMKMKLIGGINNLMDYRQPPLARDGKIEYYWGPIIGREFYASISVKL
ncbi:MAG: TonB-dependent receptor [Candidatus Stahlbacteria bacterium]|nr:TonB-dependent receptor [Candidatus Stahlbacteria bacterium]